MDPGLVVRAQQGDEAAFAAITRSVYGRFLQVSYRILRDRHLAEDATQQALVRIWRKLPRLRDPARFEAWSYRLLVNACLSEARRQGWVAVSQRWDASQPVPTLVIEYGHWSSPRRRSRSRWPAVVLVGVGALVVMVMASGGDRARQDA